MQKGAYNLWARSSHAAGRCKAQFGPIQVPVQIEPPGIVVNDSVYHRTERGDNARSSPGLQRRGAKQTLLTR